ncbi:hypothetical protein [Streptomyces sp. NPDC020681]|uniref:hypothetical protein n=1 Tax=Streptomyces sp. NPDC020681 TaxID=3365083 RepID=UPI0037A3471C
MRPVSPVGILSVLAGQSAYAQHKAEMLDQVNCVPLDERLLIASYMRKGSVVLAIMEYTTDILGAKFGTSGGSGILTDGEFYWRGDAADYVEVYGVSPGPEFIQRVRDQNGEPLALTQDEIADIDDFFVAMRRINPRGDGPAGKSRTP